ncbi:MAG: hypothetical protein PHQ84_04355 [Candidatus Omnitrophica bacterium]|jgi:hypothetical protein|nr:hypothetical protein [Candidatus Omnitrophota bacterium]MDD5078219.1 hypothetical protein [Candidatus Omnitrophota bacterium]MDD5724912.1 hypothetical protein [Candidatus Omnitrophota bacterium]
MTKPAFKNIFSIMVFLAAAVLIRPAQAQEQTPAKLIKRQVMEYNSGKMRDPFRTYLIKDEPEVKPQETGLPVKPDFDISKLQLQGVVWGVKNPQAIINGKVVSVGDLIEGAEIVSIDKKGVTLSINGGIMDLSSPGQVSTKTVTKL